MSKMNINELWGILNAKIDELSEEDIATISKIIMSIESTPEGTEKEACKSALVMSIVSSLVGEEGMEALISDEEKVPEKPEKKEETRCSQDEMEAMCAAAGQRYLTMLGAGIPIESLYGADNAMSCQDSTGQTHYFELIVANGEPVGVVSYIDADDREEAIKCAQQAAYQATCRVCQDDDRDRGEDGEDCKEEDEIEAVIRGIIEKLAEDYDD